MMNTSNEGDPGKLAYLHNANWTMNPMSDLREVPVMPGTCERCVFGRGEHSLPCIQRRAEHAEAD